MARKLKLDDQIVIEAPGNTSSIVRLLSPFVGRVVVANPILVQALTRCRSRVKGAEFPEATTRPAQARSSVSDTLLRIRSLAGSIIGTLLDFGSDMTEWRQCADFVEKVRCAPSCAVISFKCWVIGGERYDGTTAG